MENSKLGMALDAGLTRSAETGVVFGRPKFKYDFQHFRGGALIDEWSVENVVTTEGATDLVNKYFKGSGYTAAWYLGLISGTSYTSGPAITDTATNLSGTGNSWTECSATYAPDYDTPAGTNRAQITFGSPSGTDPVSLASASTVDITFSGSGTVKGAFIAAGTTRLATTAPLYSAALFTGDKTVADNDQLKVTVTVSVDLVYTP
jgi:hypothetical protein